MTRLRLFLWRWLEGPAGRWPPVRRWLDRTVLPALLLLLACSGEVAERPTAVVGETPRMAMATAVGDTQACVVAGDKSACVLISPRVDTVPVSPAVIQRGVPFLATNLWTQPSRPEWGPGPFSASVNSDGPAVIVQRINAARALGHRLMITMTGGGKSNYTVDGADAGKFSLTKWKARQDLFTTPAIKQAILAGVADGTIIGANMLDEPQHAGWQNSITKATLDSMAVYCKGLFPTLPCGASVKMSWRPTERFQQLDFIATQWIALWGPVDKWRDAELAQAKLNGVAVVFGINGLNGGGGFNETVCPFGFGETGRCQMSPSQIRETSLALAPYSCAFYVWEYRPSLVSAEKVSAFKDVAAVLANLPAKPCRRS